MKTDPAIYSQVVDASEQCMSVSLILGFNLDCSSCDKLVGFCVFMFSLEENLLVVWIYFMNMKKAKLSFY